MTSVARSVVLSACVCLAPSCGGQGEGGEPYPLDDSPLERIVLHDDGVRLYLAEDTDPVHDCAGADVRWVESDAYVTFVRVADGTTTEVDAPLRTLEDGRRFVFVSDAHIEPGTAVGLHLEDGTESRKIGGHTRPSDTAAQRPSTDR